MMKPRKRFYKHKLLLDENFPIKTHFPALNRRFDLKHIKADLNHEGLSDPEVYALARKQGRLVVTRNIKHFKELAQTSSETGVIGVSENLLFDQVDKKLVALLTKSTKKSLFGKLTVISGELSSSKMTKSSV